MSQITHDAPAGTAPAQTAHEVLGLARSELQAYLAKMTALEKGASLPIRLGLSSEISEADLPSVQDVELDDAYEIHLETGRGYVAGSNARSVLLGVYRLLQELGCRWVRPGSSGEIVPQLSMQEFGERQISICEAAAHRHRGVCIEGAPSREHVLDLIAWLPKVGMNSYFIQFRSAYAFYERWYRHLGNPTLPAEDFDQAWAVRLTEEAADFAKSRGLLYHAVGHGWTCEAVDVPSLSWIPADHAITEENRELLAEIKGKRDFFNRISLNTNLCYGNPEARRKVVAEIVRYAGEHPEVDYLHFWLADDVNNQCECSLCAETRPADFYVMMLNDLDRELEARGLRTRIVMLCYLDLLWPPERERIVNSERFALMFAPITRSFSQPFPLEGIDPGMELPPYRRNALVMPKNVHENLAFLRAWRDLFPDLDTFDFDYHLMWAHFQDPGHWQMAEVMHADAERLQANGLNGFMSCQVQRLFFPSGILMATLAGTLWNTSLPLEETINKQLSAEFGPDWQMVRDLLQEITQLCDPPRLRGDTVGSSEECLTKLDSVPRFLAEWQATARHRQALTNPTQATSWRHVDRFLELWSVLARALAAKTRGQQAEAHDLWRAALQQARASEMEIAGVFDLFHFTVTLAQQHFDKIEDPTSEPGNESSFQPA